MTRRIKIILLIMVSLLLQMAFFPAHFADPCKPTLLLAFIVYMGFRESIQWGAPLSFLLGLVQDSISGLYFGLNGFSYLFIFVALKTIAHRFYTDSRALMVLGVFLATVCNGLMNILLLLVFSLAEGVYSSILADLLPQSLCNAFVAYVIFSVVPLGRREEMP